MFLAVWIIYVADRLLDTAHATAVDLEARHLFHLRHRRAFLIGIAIAVSTLAALLPSLYPAALHLYLIEGAFLFAWFVILHATNSAHRLPKEITVGLFFSAATFIPTVGREPGIRAELLPAAILFAMICSLNCLFIYHWEHNILHDSAAHASTRLAMASLPTLAIATAIAAATLSGLAPALVKPIAAACSLAALFLLALDRNQSRLSRIDLRAAADLALVMPALVLPFLR